jgi:hypothetical protein
MKSSPDWVFEVEYSSHIHRYWPGGIGQGVIGYELFGLAQERDSATEVILAAQPEDETDAQKC